MNTLDREVDNSWVLLHKEVVLGETLSVVEIKSKHELGAQNNTVTLDYFYGYTT